MTNHYRTLGVDPQAETVVIRGAYLALIRRYHPDKGGEEADPARAQAVTAAWDVLRDPERRAAYDETRQARFQPEGGSVVGPAVLSTRARVRGGAAGRNLFLLLAAGTIGLGWWALGQPQLAPPVTAAAPPIRVAEAARPEPAVRPVDDELSARRQADVEEEQPPLPDVTREPEVEAQVVLPPLPVKDPVRMPVRTADNQPTVRRATALERTEMAARVPTKALSRPAAKAAAAPAPARPSIDLAPLERHLKLLTDQSLRYGTEAKRSRLTATREQFVARLGRCDSEGCKRDTYLRRNAEIGEIMRN
ncbi:J domain-containing protein [Sphingomonas glaciei]|uniref:J domain-containing protein n=1 Tax=Sphingomonas glaciei TaxID=2938948 RepID=A0ABY5MU69_9SPHN|nr:J domain-containing protein [Sphingomonas glaciei]UUR07642.1 J domain-containing protein [Sphingomonas glaciei]